MKWQIDRLPGMFARTCHLPERCIETCNQAPDRSREIVISGDDVHPTVCESRVGVVALRKKQVVLPLGRLTVAQSATEVHGVMEFGDTKTHQRRIINIPPSMHKMLARALEAKDDYAQVFTSPRGDVLRENNWRRRVFDLATAQIGRAGLKPHELRHTAASLAIAAGANVLEVQRLLGHKDARMTLNVSAHLFPDAGGALAVKLDDAWTVSSLETRTKRGPAVAEVVGIDTKRDAKAV